MSRLGRSQPVQPFASHGFLGNTPANGVLPPRPTLIENDGRRQLPQRIAPLQPVFTHGFLGNVPANGVLPRPISVVPLIDERRRQLPPLPPVVVNGLLASVIPPAVTPPSPSIIPLFDERRRLLAPLPPAAAHGFVDSGVGVPGTTPPAPTNIDRADQRARFLPLLPVSISGALQAVPGALPNPPAPFVVPVEERRRFLAALPPDASAGFDDAAPPQPNVSEPDDRKRRRALPPDPIGISAALSAFQPPTVLPVGPFVVPLSERNRLLAALTPPTVSHGFVDPGPGPVGTTPPPVASIDRVDQRTRYLPQKPLVLSGVLAPFIPPPPVTVLAGTDWAAAISSW